MEQGWWTGALFILGLVLLTAVVLFGGPAIRPVQEVHIVAQRYSFSPSEIKVRAGVPVRLLVSSEDTDHGFSMPGLVLDKWATRGRIATLAFTPEKPGRYEFRCVVECGPDHARMTGVLIVE